MPLTALPPEILQHVFQWLSPRDLLLLPRVCRVLRACVAQNRALCCQVYLRILVSFLARGLTRAPSPPGVCATGSADVLQDTPPDSTGLNWEAELRHLVRLESICRRPTAADKVSSDAFALAATPVLPCYRRMSSTLYTGQRIAFSKMPPRWATPRTTPIPMPRPAMQSFSPISSRSSRHAKPFSSAPHSLRGCGTSTFVHRMGMSLPRSSASRVQSCTAFSAGPLSTWAD